MQIVQTINAARSIQSLPQQASAYVTASSLPSTLPSYVNLNPVNDWTSSALIATAIETVTLPSRFRDSGGHQASLSLLEDMLNTNGRQNVFELAAGVPWRTSSARENDSAGQGRPGFSNGHANQSVANPPQANREGMPAQHTPGLDIKYATKLSQRSQGTDPHIFSQAVIQRGLIGSREEVNMTDHIVKGTTSPGTMVEK
jgi:hypothetical protein